MAVATCLLLTLGACASLDGSAKPVLPPKLAIDLARSYPVDTVYLTFRQKDDDCSGGSKWPACRDGLNKREFRDTILAIYVAAADARYEQYKRDLYRQSKGSAFGGDALVLLMNGAAVVSGTAAKQALAASSAVVIGTQSAISKDLFVEKTMPAVIASMDAGRSEVKTAIAAKQQLDEDHYTLPSALADVRLLEEKASFDAAVAKLTSTATTDAATQKKTLDATQTVGLQGSKLVTEKSAMLDSLEALSFDNQKSVAAALGATAADDQPTQIRNIRIWFLQNVTSQGAYDSAVAKAKPVTGKDSYP